MRGFFKIVTIVLLMVFNQSFAQDIDMRLAKEYFNEAEYDKAISYFEELFENPQVQQDVYEDYLASLLYTQRYDDAIKMNKKISKKYPSDYEYKVDKGVILLKSGDKDKSDKYFEDLKKFQNVVLSPHVAGWSFESKEKMAKVILEKIHQKFQTYIND
jgi:tetratricopeptide (TPR) repeat protein